MDFDVLIRGGLLTDGSGALLHEADVGINGDRISAVGDLRLKKARREIDARGKIVAPGFVDIHGHSDYFILIEPAARSKLFQGVTTEIGGNCGYSAAPIGGELAVERAESLDKNFGLKPDWKSLREYYLRLEKTKIGINLGIQIGHNTVRASVMGGAARPPSASELDAMLSMIRAGMKDGALGISAGLIYPPSCFADKDELAAICKPVAEAGGFFSTHMRSEGAELLEAISEVVGAAEKARVRLEISHFKTSGAKNWGKIDDAIKLIEDAQARGLDVRCDRYPYTASYTGLSAVFPNWVFEGSRDEYRARLAKPEIQKKIKAEIIETNGAGYLDRVNIAQTFSEHTHQYEGLSVTKAAESAGKEPFDFLFDLLSSEKSDPTAIYHTMNEENMIRILNLPYASVGSDAAVRGTDGPLASGKPHPRVYGCFPRMLQMVREKRIMSLETAIHKMTAAPANAAGIEKRGLIKPGWFADVVVFDPDKIADEATYDDPRRYASGVVFVLVNGSIAVENGEYVGTKAGRVVLKNGELR